jgi:NAD(P)-dependent dehydrogenase (short-subunit alcohol dehydrogenase family)
MRLAGKVALITGAGSGIGRAASLLFAREGASVAVCDLDPAGGEATVQAVRKAGGEAWFVRADVSKEAEVAAAMRQAESRYGRLNALYANAGIFSAADTVLTELTEAELDRVLGVNLKGVMWTCKHGIPLLRKGGGGSIVITGSLAGLKAGDATAYYVSKAAVVHLARCLARQYAADNIRVNCICPGKVETNLMAEVRRSGPRKAPPVPVIVDGYNPRYAKPEEIAAMALNLSCDDMSFVTGAVIPVDNGAMTR